MPSFKISLFILSSTSSAARFSSTCAAARSEVAATWSQVSHCASAHQAWLHQLQPASVAAQLAGTKYAFKLQHRLWLQELHLDMRTPHARLRLQQHEPANMQSILCASPAGDRG